MAFDREKIDISKIITTCFESKEMQDHLIEHSDKLDQDDIIDIIRGAPIPLRIKTDLMKDVDAACYKEMKAALDALELKDDQFFIYSQHGYERIDGILEHDEWYIGPCRDLNQVSEYLLEELIDDEELDYAPDPEILWERRKENMCWGQLELYESDGQNGFRDLATYYLIADQVCYFERTKKPQKNAFWACGNDFDYSWHCVDLNIDIPFRPGDIVTVDCRPFAKDKHIVLLEVGWDCCGVQAMHWNDERNEGKWDTGAVKHGSIFGEGRPMISPLYRIEMYTGELTEDEKHLSEVSRRIAGDPETGRKIWNEMNGY